MAISTTIDPFVSYITPVLQKEKGYVDNPADKGGPTNFGITQATARANGFNGDMRNLTFAMALTILRSEFYVQPQYDQLMNVSKSIGIVMIDLGVNMYPTWPSKMLQRALNVCRYDKQGNPMFSELTVDGQCGAGTRSALAHVLRDRGPEAEIVVANMILGQAAVRYIEIAEGDISQEQFEYGWQFWRVTSSVLTLPHVAEVS